MRTKGIFGRPLLASAAAAASVVRGLGARAPACSGSNLARQRKGQEDAVQSQEGVMCTAYQTQ
jgi:hypothetical protein